MKTLILTAILIPLATPAHAELFHHRGPKDGSIVRLEQMRPGQEIGFPLNFELRRGGSQPGLLSHRIVFDGDEKKDCVFEAWANGSDVLQIGSRLYWNIDSPPRSVHEIGRKERTYVSLVERRSGRRMSMTCDARISPDDLRENDFDIPLNRRDFDRDDGDVVDRPARVERLSAPADEAPAANATQAI